MPAAPLNPPAEWFDHPGEIPTDRRVTITADGRVFGYVALWNSCHVGLEGCQPPPQGSPTDYSYAHQGQTQLADGKLLATANIGGGAGHAPLDASNAAKFYENTSSQMMRVRYGEDANGLYFAGALWPDVNELDVARIRASAISGDWRWFASWRKTDAGYDFSGACLVNVPGYAMESEGDVVNRPGRMMQLAASLGGDAYSLDAIPVQEVSMCECAIKAAPIKTINLPAVKADCGCGGYAAHGGEEVSGPAHQHAEAEVLGEVLQAMSMKLDENLSRLAKLEGFMMQMEADRLTQKIVE